MQFPDARILIVDDEEGIRDLFRDNLQGRGYRCGTAPDGTAALELLTLEEYDLAIVDMMMPGMSGISLFEQIRQNWPDLAVIFVTAVDKLGLAVDHLKKGAYDYIVKPVKRRTLAQAVEDALAKRQALLQHGGRLTALVEETAKQATLLQARGMELLALNRMFQAELTARFSEEEDQSLEDADKVESLRPDASTSTH